MLFFAFYRDEYLTSAPTLEEVLAFVTACTDPSFAEDAVVWHGGKIVALVFSSGSFIRFDSYPVPAPMPADLTRLDEAAA
jgi:hypothetical protein